MLVNQKDNFMHYYYEDKDWIYKDHKCSRHFMEDSEGIVKAMHKVISPSGEKLECPISPYEYSTKAIELWIDLGYPTSRDLYLALGRSSVDLKSLKEFMSQNNTPDMKEEILKLSGLLNEEKSEMPMSEFAKKRHDGAEKIANNAKEKGGVALLTYNHFIVKLPYYNEASKGKFNFKKMKKKYQELCSQLHSYMEKIEEVDQTKFQKLVGEIEVIGELLIKNKE